MNELTDPQLITAAMKADVRAFGRIVERHHAAVTAIAFAMTRDLATSELIAQDTFIIGWTQLQELRDLERARAWLCGIARNLSRSELRDRVHGIADIDAVKLASSDTVDALGLIEAAEAEHQVRNALDDLPPSHREALVVFYLEGRSIERVASALDITVEAAQKRIDRARTLIAGEIEEHFATLARSRRATKAAAASVVAIIATGGAQTSDAGRWAVENALPAPLIGARTAAAMVAVVATIAVVWLLAAM